MLVRYVGFFAAPVGALLLLGAPGPGQTRLTRAGAFLLSFALVCGPWFLYLGTIGRPPRHIAVHTAEFWPQLKYQLSSTISGWVLPLSVPPRTRLMLLLLVALAVAAVYLYRRSGRGAGRLTLVASSLAAGYIAFVLAARLLADHNIPFDNRMFGPAALLLTIAIAAWLGARSASAASSTAVIAAAAWLAVIGGRESVRALGWAVSEPTSLPALQELPPGARIYSNSPRAIVLQLRRPVKLTPAVREWGVVGRYRQQLGSDPVAALVLFPQGWPNLIPRDELVRALGLRLRADPAEPMVFVLTSGLPAD